MSPVHKHFSAAAAGLVMLLAVGIVQAARESNIAATKHNLSASGAGSLRATTQTEICVFCHTPHGSTSGVTPLWNRKLSTATYIPYSSNSLDANQIQGTLDQPGGSSKLCLSCHDGTMAIGNVNVFGGSGSFTTQGTVAIAMTGTGTSGTTTGVISPGSGITTGFTRNLGTDLRNDHPISVTYNDALVARDGELRLVNATTQKDTSTSGALIGVRGIGYKPKMPLEPTGTSTDKGQVQCATCHDPHIRETDSTQGNQKFLRLNRFQTTASGANGATKADFDASTDIICLACHDKNMGSNGAWAFSAHANDLVATQTYSSNAASLREFPANLPVWRAACMNCHDTHTVPGARRLLREGTDGAGSPKVGGASAIEETCYQCHDGSTTVLNASVAKVPNIKTDFGLTVKMPITSTNQRAAGGVEIHDIGGDRTASESLGTGSLDCTTPTNKCGKDFVESRALIGKSDINNRHAECTDCHNPHRVIKSQTGLPGLLSAANTNAAGGTHKHDGASNFIHTNEISGVLRGSFGVEPVYPDASFSSMPSSFKVLRGDPGSHTTTTAELIAQTDTVFRPVTREYQICLKCHSNYAYTDQNTYPNSLDTSATGRPQIGGSGGGTTAAMVTAAGHVNFKSFTNQAKEFQATHTGGGARSGSGASTTYTGGSNNNHRSFHPVMGPTGRDATARGGLAASNWQTPWSNTGALGTQTMYCSDCHGSKVTATDSVRPDGNGTTALPTEDGSPWGPHGSNNPFLLKGLWNKDTGMGQQTDGLCFKCHKYSIYTGSGTRTGFWISSGASSGNDGHKLHRDKINARNTNNTFYCNYCHVAVPHGWKNKAFLVNLNDLGPEIGLTAGTPGPVITDGNAYSNGPYYRNAILRVNTFKASGQWSVSDCMGGDKDSMIAACKNPP